MTFIAEHVTFEKCKNAKEYKNENDNKTTSERTIGDPFTRVISEQ